MSIAIPFGQLDVAGSVKTYETRAFSGKRKQACFCEICGTRLWHRIPGTDDQITLKVGTLDEKAAVDCYS
jgi:hypothetical protein